MKKSILLITVCFAFLFNCNQSKKSESISNENMENSSKQDISNSRHTPYGEIGLNYAHATQSVLGKNLMGAIQNKGILDAITFCNEKAYPLTDSVALAHHATIKRVSDKPRNENNQANTEELEHINTFKKAILNQEEIHPIVKEMDEKVQVFYPITTNAMCLQCHGKPNETLKNVTLKKLKTIYPNDKAIGYNLNEVRGIWTVTFDK